jgi:hypothetical protein
MSLPSHEFLLGFGVCMIAMVPILAVVAVLVRNSISKDR